MSEILTPRQVAKAIGISESSLKRWCDSGRLPAMKTAGGHRRLKRADILRLVRDGDLALNHPEALGLQATAGRGDWTLESALDPVTEALIQGNFEAVKLISVDLFLSGCGIAAICDRVLAVALHEIGQRWEHDGLGEYEERRGTLGVIRVLHHLRELLPRPLPNAVTAIGGCPPGDDYTSATMMVELVLVEAGWRACSLGGPLPLDSLLSAVEQQCPRLFWLSVSTLEDDQRFAAEYEEFYARVPSTTAVVLGGRGITDALKKRLRYAAHCDDLQDLVEFVRVLQPARITPETSAN